MAQNQNFKQQAKLLNTLQQTFNDLPHQSENTTPSTASNDLPTYNTTWQRQGVI
jgi:hypothetical protein